MDFRPCADKRSPGTNVSDWSLSPQTTVQFGPYQFLPRLSLQQGAAAGARSLRLRHVAGGPPPGRAALATCQAGVSRGAEDPGGNRDCRPPWEACRFGPTLGEVGESHSPRWALCEVLRILGADRLHHAEQGPKGRSAQRPRGQRRTRFAVVDGQYLTPGCAPFFVGCLSCLPILLPSPTPGAHSS